MIATLTFARLGFIDPEVSARLCLTLLHSLWLVALLAVAVRGLGWLLRRRPIERQYTLHVAALVLAVAALPVTYALVGTATPSDTEAVAVLPAQPLSENSIPADQWQLIPQLPQQVEQPAEPATPIIPAETPALELPAPAPQEKMHLGLQLAPWLAAVYLCGVVLMLVRLGMSIWRASRLVARARPVTDAPLVELFRRLAAGWSLRVLPRLAQAEAIVVPKVVGLLKPTILLPASAVTGLTTSELEMILAHELAHVRRHDMWVNLLQRLAEAVLFFNPALWYLSRRISTLREYACDEAACRQLAHSSTEPQLQYAQALMRVVELSAKEQPQADLMALAATGRTPSELRRRVARLFGEPLREPVRISRGGVVAVVVAALLLATSSTVWTGTETNKQETIDSQPEDNRPATISGRIVRQDGSPASVEGGLYFTVDAEGYNPSGTSIDVNESFESFTHTFPPGRVWVNLVAKGFAPTEVTFDLKAGEEIEDISLVLGPGFTQRVKLVNLKDEPVQGATVIVHAAVDNRNLGPTQEHVTNENGECLLENMANTRFKFTITAPGYLPLETIPWTLRPDEVRTFTMIQSTPNTGVVRYVDGSPAIGAKIYCKHEFQADGTSVGDEDTSFGTLFADSKNSRTIESWGRFSLDELTEGSHYLFVVEAMDGARAIVTDLQLAQSEPNIVLPNRSDLYVQITGNLARLTQSNRRPRLSVRQRVNFAPDRGKAVDVVIAEEVPIDLTHEDGTAMFYRGVPVDLRPDASYPIVEVSLNYPDGPTKLARINPTGHLYVTFDLDEELDRGDAADKRTNVTIEDAEADTDELSFGGEVEVIAIGTHGEESQRWWDAQGRMLDSHGISWHGVSGSDRFSADNSFRRRVVLSIKDLPADAHVFFRVPGARRHARGYFAINEETNPKGYFARYLEFQGEPDTGLILVGVAAGDWRTVIEAESPGAYSDSDGKGILLSEILETSNSTQVVVSHNYDYRERDYRMVAVDKEGKSHVQSGRGGSSSQNISMANARFPGITPEQIGHFEFQVRDYEWVEIKGLPLEPIRIGDSAEIDQRVEGTGAGTGELDVTNADEETEVTQKDGPSADRDVEIASLRELVEFYDQIYRRIDELHKLGAQGGEETKRALALLRLSQARAELAEALNKPAEALQHYEQAVQAAEENVAAQRAIYDFGRTPLETVLQAGAQRAEAKLALERARQRLGKDQEGKESGEHREADVSNDNEETEATQNDGPSTDRDAEIASLRELARPPEASYEHPITIHLTGDDKFIYAGRESDNLALLRSALLRETQTIERHSSKEVADVRIIIRADEEAKTGLVQEVIRICQELGFERFAVRGKQSDEHREAGEEQEDAEVEAGAAVDDQAQVSEPRFIVREVRRLTTPEDIESAKSDPQISFVPWPSEPEGPEVLAWPSDQPVLFSEVDVAEVVIKQPEPSNLRRSVDLYSVQIKLTKEAGARMAEVSTRLVEQDDPDTLLQLSVDGKTLMAAKVMSKLTDALALSGRFTKERAEEIANIIKPGAIAHEIETAPAATEERDEREPISAQVLEPTGEPVVDAKVALWVANSQITINNGEIDEDRLFASRTTTDQAGRFSFPTPLDLFEHPKEDEPFEIIVTHPTGFGHFKSDDGPVPENITLVPWARVEGTFLMRGEPLAGSEIQLNDHLGISAGHRRRGILTQQSATTDDQGRFVFEHAVPGRATIARHIQIPRDEESTVPTSFRLMSVELQSGANVVEIDSTEAGRPVIGQLAPAPELPFEVKWQFVMVQALADLAQPERPRIPAEVPKDPTERQAWLENWKETPEGKTWQERQLAYEQALLAHPSAVGTVDDEGNFRLDSLPPGDYVLMVFLPGEAPEDHIEYRFTVRPINGERSDDPLDLGEIRLQD